jgi:tetraacyldisaccharide 4'-kinase
VRFDALLNNAGLKLALSPLLLPASVAYAAGLWLDRRFSGARRVTLPVPTISVGNLTVGGTGKTPVLLRVASDLRALGRRPFILTRGYAGPCVRTSAGVVRSPADAAGFSDEVRLMSEALSGVPIAAGPNRGILAARVLAGGQEDVALVDDGFQHWKLGRDLDIVCIDATDPWGGGFLLPLGRLREPRGALVRAGIVLITRCERASGGRVDDIWAAARRLAPGAEVLRSRFELKLLRPDGQTAAALPGRAIAVSAIGNPGAFEANLAALGIRPAPLRFGDHHAYTARDWQNMSARARAEGIPVVTTAKDWVKLREVRTDDGTDVLIAAQSLSFLGDDRTAWESRIGAALRPR